MCSGKWEITAGATCGDCAALAEDIWPGELPGERLDAKRRLSLCAAFAGLAQFSRTYVAKIDGRLAGICFVEEFEDRREMSFAKTRHLAERRRITFARSIRSLLLELTRFESAAFGDGKPLCFHTPEGDEKSLRWFVEKGGCRVENGKLKVENGK